MCVKVLEGRFASRSRSRSRRPTRETKELSQSRVFNDPDPSRSVSRDRSIADAPLMHHDKDERHKEDDEETLARREREWERSERDLDRDWYNDDDDGGHDAFLGDPAKFAAVEEALAQQSVKKVSERQRLVNEDNTRYIYMYMYMYIYSCMFFYHSLFLNLFLKLFFYNNNNNVIYT